MSEYLSKKAVLEWLDDRRYKSPWIESFRERLESGAFDADNTEIQRLRAALEKAKQYVVNGYELGYIDDREGYTEALVREIDKALSTTTEPTRAAKVERVREGDGNGYT